MVSDYIVDLTQYLNKNGFNITNENINRFFKMMADDDIDFTDENDVVTLMKTVFCTNRIQYENFGTYFNDYMVEKSNSEKISNLEKELEESNKAFINSQKVIQEQLKDILKNIGNVEGQIKDDVEEDSFILSEEDKAFLLENILYIKKVKFKDKRFKIFIRNISEEQWKEVEGFSNDFYYGLSKEVSEFYQEALRKNDNKKYTIYHQFYSIVKKLQKVADDFLKTANKKIRNETKELKLEKKRIEDKIKKEEIEHKKNLSNIDKEINSLKKENKTIVKNTSLMNRDVFIKGRNFVIALDAPECVSKDFDKLSRQEFSTIYKYIKKNLLKFKTKVSRKINTKNKNNINMKDTILNACKTGGLPFHIYYEKPKTNKTKIMLVLDISGSCSNASRMMLSFMYLLKSVFPGGCITYAFVDCLYDISAIMNSNSDDINNAINDILNYIPRHGVYSNYYVPIKDLWEKHKKDITSDTIIIFMGDARNNNNESGEEFVKNIARKAKKAYWLNTEPFEEWGNSDSLAYKYAKYFKMFEVLNTAQLINFIDKI